MAEITLDNLKQKIAGLEQQRQQTYDQVNALTGAIQLAQQLVREIEAPDPPPPSPPQD